MIDRTPKRKPKRLPPHFEELCALAYRWTAVLKPWLGPGGAFEVRFAQMEEEAGRACRMKKGAERKRILSDLEAWAAQDCKQLRLAQKDAAQVFKRAGELLGTDDPIEIEKRLAALAKDCEKRGLWRLA